MALSATAIAWMVDNLIDKMNNMVEGDHNKTLTSSEQATNPNHKFHLHENDRMAESYNDMIIQFEIEIRQIQSAVKHLISNLPPLLGYHHFQSY